MIVAYLHDTQERLTLLASHPATHIEAQRWVEQQALNWLAQNEPDSEARVVIAKVVERIDAGDFVMRGAVR